MVADCDYGASPLEVKAILENLRSNPATLPALNRWGAAFSALGDRLGELQQRVLELENLVADELARE